MPLPDQHRETVRGAALAAGAIGVPGSFSFGLDVTAMAGIWAGMTATIVEESGHKVDGHFAAKLAASLATGVAAYVGGSKIVVMLLHWFPGAGTLAVMGINSSLNFWFTYRVGRAVAGLFSRPNFELMDVGEMALMILPAITRLPRASEVDEVIRLVRG